jgi:hypothetical protein
MASGDESASQSQLHPTCSAAPMLLKSVVGPALFSLCVAGLAAPAVGAGTPGTCDLKSPPPQARRLPTHGVDFLIWPVQIHTAFTGCQKVWLEDGTLLITTVYKKGQVQTYTAKEPDSKTTLRCDYRQPPSKQKPPHGDCPALDDFPLWPADK